MVKQNKLGELELNKVHCMDCLEGMKLLPDNSVDLVVTDPPYGMSYQSNHRKQNSNNKHIPIRNDDNLDWLNGWCLETKRIIKNDSHCYIFCSWHNIDIFLRTISNYMNIKNILVWDKGNMGMGDLEGDYGTKTEFIIYCSNSTKKLNGKRDSNLLKFNRTQNVLHPTEKPVDIFKFLIEKSSTIQDKILDPFIGSGTTAVACKQLDRQFIGFEIEQKYVDVCNKRLNQKYIYEF